MDEKKGANENKIKELDAFDKHLKMGKFVSKVKNMANALEQELLQYILQLDDAEKKSVLQMLKTFVKGREAKTIRVSIVNL